MTLRINTNISAMNAHKSMLKNSAGLSASLEKLSSGLRINKAADDASGMAIADSLRSQGLSLGQAIRNANDGISMVQTADGALEESINIVNIIKTKAIQAAQDGQTTESRLAIQADINKLMEELDIIAKTTSFNNQKLLSGNFTNKKFQVGAYSGETISISIGTGESTKIGHISTSDLTVAGEGTASLAVFSNIQNATFDINSVDILYDNTRENSMGALADAINKLSDTLGITANASVTSTTDFAVNAGSTDSTFEINGVHIGELTIQQNDADGALVASINFKTDQHGVFASVDEQGKLTLTSVDDRAIEVTQDTNTTAVLGNTTDMSTLGKIALTQNGTAEIVVLDRSGGQAVALAGDGLLETTGVINTTAESTLASGSTIQSGSTIAGGSTLATGGTLEAISGNVFTTGSSTIGDNSILLQGTIINSGSTLTGTVTTSGVTAGTGTLGSGSVLALGSTIGGGTTTNFSVAEIISGATATTGASTMTIGTTFEAGSQLDVGTVMLSADFDSGQLSAGWAVSTSGLYVTVTTNAVVSGTGAMSISNGSVSLATSSILGDDSLVGVGSTVSDDVMYSTAVTTAGDMTLTSGSSFITATDLAEGTVLTGDTIDVGATYTLGGDMTLTAGSTIMTGSSLATGSNLSNAWYNATGITVTGGNMTLGASSSLVSGAVFANGSSLGGTVTTTSPEVINSTTDMLVAGGSTLASGTTIAAGTMLTNDVVANDGNTYTAGTQLISAITTSGATTLTAAMTLNGGSILAAGSTLTVNDAAADASAVSSTSDAVSHRLSDVNVTTQESAQIAIAVADAALKSLNKVRSGLGSVQNQLTSTIANITVTRVNIFSAESAIRDVDFAEEASNFTKMQILSQASAFAMAQANASSQVVLSLLQ